MLRTETRERLQRWVAHFYSEILNRDDPMISCGIEDDIVESEEIEEIDVGRWRLQEVKDALKKTARETSWSR